MDNPTFFFVAHVMVKHNTAKEKYQHFQEITTGSIVADILKYQDKKYLTFVAHFDAPQDFRLLEIKLRSRYGGKSKVFKVDYSTTDHPTYYYSTCLVPNMTHSQKHHGFYDQKSALLRAAVALITAKPKLVINYYECSALIEFPDHDIRQEDIASLQNILQTIPNHVIMTSRKPLQRKEVLCHPKIF